MARSKRAALCAIAALALVPASAQAAGEKQFTVGTSDVSWTGGGLGLNQFNVTACPNENPAIRCDAAILTADKAGTLTVNLDILSDTADFDLYLYRGSQWSSAGEVDGDTGHFIGEDESVTVAAGVDEQFRVEIVYFLTGPTDTYNATASIQ